MSLLFFLFILFLFEGNPSVHTFWQSLPHTSSLALTRVCVCVYVCVPIYVCVCACVMCVRDVCAVRNDPVQHLSTLVVLDGMKRIACRSVLWYITAGNTRTLSKDCLMYFCPQVKEMALVDDLLSNLKPEPRLFWKYLPEIVRIKSTVLESMVYPISLLFLQGHFW